MDAKTSRIAKNTGVLYVRMLFLMCISLYTSRVVLKALGVEDYGIYNVIGGFVSLFSIVSASLTGANSRFLNFEMGKGHGEQLVKVFSTCVTIQYIMAVIIAVLCETVGIWYVNKVMVLPPERLHAARWCFQFSIFNFCMNLVTVPYNAAIVAHEKMKAFAYVSLFEGIAKLLICFIILWNPIDRLVYYALLLLVEQFVVRLMYQLYCRRHFQECTYSFVFDKVLLKQIFAYSGWHIIGSSSSILSNHGVNLVLNFFFGPIVNAAKGVSNQVLHAVRGFVNNFMMAINPQITQSYAKGEISYMLNLVHKGSRFSYYILFVIALPIIINADYLLRLWLTEVPEYSVRFCQLTLIQTLIASFSNPLITAQNATGKVRNYQLVVGGIAMLNLPVSYLVLRLGFSPVSVFVVAIFVEIMCLAARLIMIPKYIPEFSNLSYFRYVLGNCMAVSVMSILIPMALKSVCGYHIWSFILICLVCVVSSVAAILFIGCSTNERHVVLHKLKSVINKL